MEILSEIGSILIKATPLLAAAISSTSPLAAVAISLISSALGVKNDPQSILDSLNADPANALKLKQVELDHEVSLQQISSDNYKAEVDDRKDARKLAEESDADYKVFLRQFAYFITLGFFVTLGLLFLPFLNLTSTEKQLLSMLIGMLASKWQTIIDFFYGSSNH